MKHLKRFANTLILEQIQNYKQLALFDDAFSSRTIAFKLLKHYKSHKLVDNKATIKTAREAYLATKSRDVLSKAAKEAMSNNNGDNGHFDFVRISSDIMEKYMPSEPEELHAFMEKLADEDILTDDDAYSALLDGYSPKELDEFTSIINNETDEQIDLEEVHRALAYQIEYVDKNSYEDLMEIFGYDISHKMFMEEVVARPESLDLQEFRQLSNTLKNLGDAKKITIYRAITLPFELSNLDTALGQNEGVGIFWSYVQSGAIAHNGSSKGFTLALEAEVDIKNIDWDSTFYKSLYDLREELEIELKPGYTVNVTGYTLDCPDTDKLIRSLTHYYYGDLELTDQQLQKLGDNIESLRHVKVSPAIVVKA